MTTVGISAPGLPLAGSEAAVTSPATRRSGSIDIFRGITMAVMIFVNDLASVHGMPWWTEHAPARLDEMTYVDMVFPFFLFAVGLSLPLSVAQRLRRNLSQPALWWHIVTRAIALIVLGLILANAEKTTQMGISGSTWGILGLLCASLYLGVYGKSDRARNIGRILRIAGFVGVVILLVIYRRVTPSGQTAWIDFSYPEILGLIGCSYLAISVLYVPTRRWTWAPTAWFVLLTAFNAFSSAHWINFPNRLPILLWPYNNGAMCSIMMAGIMVSSLFLSVNHAPAPHKATWTALGFAALAFAAGRLLTPLGISKIRATPTWSLYCIGAAVLLFALFYWLCDVKHWQRWAALVRPGGENTLLTYLLPDLWYFALSAAGVTYLKMHWNAGWPGVARAVVFTLLILVVSGMLTRAKVRLQL